MECRKNLYKRAAILRHLRRTNKEFEVPCSMKRVRTETPVIYKDSEAPRRRRPAFDNDGAPTFARKKAPNWITEYREMVGETGEEILQKMQKKAKKAARLKAVKLKAAQQVKPLEKNCEKGENEEKIDGGKKDDCKKEESRNLQYMKDNCKHESFVFG